MGLLKKEVKRDITTVYADSCYLEWDTHIPWLVPDSDIRRYKTADKSERGYLHCDDGSDSFQRAINSNRRPETLYKRKPTSEGVCLAFILDLFCGDVGNLS